MTAAGPRTGPTSRRGLINRLRDGVVYNDSVRIGTSGDHDKCATDAIIDEAAEMIVKLEDALYAAWWAIEYVVKFRTLDDDEIDGLRQRALATQNVLWETQE